MFPLIEKYLDSEQTQKAFSAAHGVSEAVFHYWLRKYRDEKADHREAFIEITPAAGHPALVEVDYPSGVRVRLYCAVTPAYLAQLISTAR
jgi:transposase-like protein